jgi:hypothetical protein
VDPDQLHRFWIQSQVCLTKNDLNLKGTVAPDLIGLKVIWLDYWIGLLSIRIADSYEISKFHLFLYSNLCSLSGMAKHDLRCMQFVDAACKVIKSVRNRLPFATAPKVI